MKKTIIATLLIVCVLSGFAQSAADSVRFCSSNEWNVKYQENGVTVRELKSKSKDKATHLFGESAQIFVMEIAANKYRIQLFQSANRKTPTEAQKELDGVAAVNAGFFVVDPQPKNAAIANDFLKIDGRIISPNPTPGWGSAAFAVADDGTLSFTMWDKSMDIDTVSGWSARFKNVMVAGPMLILDGQPIPSSDPGKHPRTAIGTRPDGTVVLIVVDGRSFRASGATFEQMSTLGHWLGLNNMLNLDGGGSSAMVYKRTLINFPSDGLGLFPIQRKVANSVVIVPK